MTDEERFWSRVDRRGPDDCWLWNRGTNGDGYGCFKCDGGEQIGAHRFSWSLENGPIPAGKHVLHSCDNPPCVNPDHLFLGTHSDNLADAAEKGRMHGGRAKLTNEQVLEIRTSDLSLRKLAAKFGVTFQAISYARRGHTHKYHISSA